MEQRTQVRCSVRFLAHFGPALELLPLLGTDDIRWQPGPTDGAKIRTLTGNCSLKTSLLPLPGNHLKEKKGLAHRVH